MTPMIYLNDVERQATGQPFPLETPSPPLWNHLDPAQRTQLAQQWAELIRRMRERSEQEKDRDEE